MVQSSALELPRCPQLDQQHREYEEFKKKEIKRNKKKEYIKNKKDKNNLMKMPTNFDG